MGAIETIRVETIQADDRMDIRANIRASIRAGSIAAGGQVSRRGLRAGAHARGVAVAVVLAGLAVPGLAPWGPAAADAAAGARPETGLARGGLQLAQLAGQSRDFDIPAQPLPGALARFGQQSGLQVTVDGALVRSLSAPAVRGTMTAEQALQTLLSGSGLVYRIAGGTTVAIEAGAAQSGGATVIGPITVEGRAARDAGRTEDSGSYAGSQVSVGSKTPATVREIPQSVSVVTRQRIEDENLVSVQDAVERTTGMRVITWDNDRASFTARGYDASVLRDGVATSHRTNYTAAPDLTAYDRIEVMRGPAGLFHGAGEPGGSINLVRKRALDEFRASGAVRAGSWDNYLAEADVTGPLLESGRVRGRVAASYQDKESFTDLLDQKKPVVYGTAEADLTPDTTLSVGGIYFEQDKHQFQGLPIAFTNGVQVKLPRDTNIGGRWSRGDESSADLFAELEHRFDSGVLLKLSGRTVRQEREGIVSYVTSAIDPATGSVNNQAWGFDNDSDQESVDANASVPAAFFGQTQTFLVGADYSRLRDTSRWRNSAVFTLNAFAPNHDVPEPAFNALSTFSTTETTQMGTYGQANIKPGVNWLTLIGGGRVTWWDSVNTNHLTGTVTSDTAANGEFTPKAAAVAELTDRLSVYGSYASIFQPQTALTPTGQVVAPRVGDQYEIGLKGEFMDGRLIAHLAAYQIEDENRATTIDGCIGTMCSEAAGLVRSRGFEAEVSGEPLPGWQVLAGYAYTYATYIEDPTNKGNVFASYTPKHMFNMSVTHRFRGGDLDGLSLGGGMRVRSSYFNVTGGNRYTQEAFALFDARIGYDLTENISAQFAVNNLFDEEYYERLGGLTRNNYWGEPRSFMLTVRARW